VTADVGGSQVPPGFRPFEPYETAAVSLRLFEHTLIPGLLQTEAYARAVLEAHPNTGADEVEERFCGCCWTRTC
jgi:Domain of unknown function (DUF5753)